MKNLFLGAIVLLLSVNFATAQSMGEPKVQFSKIINISANEFWKTVRQMDKIDQYSSNIARVEWTGKIGKGGQRVCYTPDGKGYFKEKIVAYNESAKTFSYSLLEGAPVKGMVNTIKVVDLGYGKCVFVFWSDYEQFIENPQMTQEQFHAFMTNSLEEMTEKMAKDS
ncbi:MAG: SRPBCC family protein [Bacteroidota bacterium]